MIRITCVILLFLGSWKLSLSQQLPQYTQYMHNAYGLNPAFSGIKNCPELIIGDRHQWLGFEGAPTTQFMGFNGTVLKPKNPFTQGKHVMGIYVENDEAARFSQMNGNISYSYHLRLAQGLYGGFGFFAGATQYKISNYQMILDNPGDPSASAGSSLIKPNINPGMVVYSKWFYFGLSVKNVLANKIQFNGVNSRLAHHILLNAGTQYYLPRNSNWSFSTTGIVKISTLSAPSLEITGIMDYKRRIAFGLSLRSTEAMAGILRLGVTKFFDIGYSYDYTLSKIRNYSSNSHELMLIFRVCNGAVTDVDNKQRETCPAYH